MEKLNMNIEELQIVIRARAKQINELAKQENTSEAYIKAGDIIDFYKDLSEQLSSFKCKEINSDLSRNYLDIENENLYLYNDIVNAYKIYSEKLSYAQKSIIPSSQSDIKEKNEVEVIKNKASGLIGPIKPNKNELIEIKKIEKVKKNTVSKAEIFRDSLLKVLPYAIALTIGGIATALLLNSCGKQKNNEPATSIESENNDYEITIAVEPEHEIIAIDDAIANNLSSINTGEMEVTDEQLLDMANYFNSNTNKFITFDDVSTYVSIIVNANINKDLAYINKAHGFENTTGYDVGNFELSSLFVENDITKQALIELETIDKDLKSEDENIRYEAFKKYLYIINAVGNEIKDYSSYEVTIDGNTINHDNDILFYQLDNASDRVAYLSELYAIAQLADSLYPKSTITVKSDIAQDETMEANQTVSATYDIQKLLLELNSQECEEIPSLLNGNILGSVSDANARLENNEEIMYDVTDGVLIINNNKTLSR